MSRSLVMGLLALGAISCSTGAAKEPPKDGTGAGNLPSSGESEHANAGHRHEGRGVDRRRVVLARQQSR